MRGVRARQRSRGSRPPATRTPAGGPPTTFPRRRASRPPRPQSRCATAFSWRGLSHMRASQYVDAKIGERAGRPALPPSAPGCAPVIPGEVLTSRKVHRPSGLRIRSRRPQPEQPTMRNAASDCAWIATFDRGIDSRRAEVLGVVRKILVVIVVVAFRRLDADERQRTLAEDRCRQFGAGDEFLDDDQVVVLRRRGVGRRQFVVIDRGDARDADGRAFARGLDDQRQAQFGDDRPPVGRPRRPRDSAASECRWRATRAWSATCPWPVPTP